MIRTMVDKDAETVLDIYKMGIETGNATFETSVPDWKNWSEKHLKHSRFVFENNNSVVGWVVLSAISQRAVYAGVAEVSIYVHPKYFGKQIGSQLMEAVLKSSEENGIWTLQSSIFPENIATLKLHEKFGFRIVGMREKIAQLNHIWRNTIILERRSKITGN